MRHSFKILSIGVLALTSLLAASPLLLAQSTGDTLPTRTPTPTVTLATPPLNTVEIRPSATPTPSPLPVKWAARLASNTLGVTGGNGSIFRIFVEGRVGIPVEVRNSYLSMTGQTGSKPEYGPFAAEFAPVPAGTWLVSVPSLGVSLPVEADGYNLAVIEFFQRSDDTPSPSPASATDESPAPTPSPATTPSATPTATPSATLTATPTATLLPSPSPTPAAQPQWLGTVDRQKRVGDTSLTVRVVGIEGLAIHLQSLFLPEPEERRCVTGRDNLGQDVCSFDNLPPGFYTITPEGLPVQLPVRMTAYETAAVQFDRIIVPAGNTGWQAKVHKNSNGPIAHPAAQGTLFFRMTGQPGQVVAVWSSRGLSRLCEMLPNPVFGMLTCQVSGLPPGVYQLEAVNTGASLWLFVDGVGQADIEFLPGSPDEAGAGAAMVGGGASPLPATPTPVIPTPIPVAVQPAPTFTPTPTVTLTPTVAFAWQGRVVERVDLVIGTIGVRAAGLKDHPVVIRSGGWQSAVQLTGTKPELGDYATEFGGLAQGEYIVELVGLAEYKVTLGADQFVLVEFRYEPVSLP